MREEVGTLTLPPKKGIKMWDKMTWKFRLEIRMQTRCGS